MSDEASNEYVVTAGRVIDLAKAKALGTDPIMRLPDNMFINFFSSNIQALLNDPESGRVVILLGSLYRKHGPFALEVLERKITSAYGVQPR